jgi:hypothetical protein
VVKHDYDRFGHASYAYEDRLLVRRVVYSGERRYACNFAVYALRECHSVRALDGEHLYRFL